MRMTKHGRRIFTEEEKIKILQAVKEHEKAGITIKDAIKKEGIGAPVFYRWCRQFGGQSLPKQNTPKVKKLKSINEIEPDNEGSKKYVIIITKDKSLLADVLGGLE